MATGTRQKVQVDKPVSFTVKAGENNPSKKPAEEPKRPYNKIEDYKECPYCGAKPKSYDSYRQHISYRCKSKANWLEIPIKMNLRISRESSLI